MPAFCASCTEERADLEAVWQDGRRVHLCGDCREGPLRGGSYSFGGGSATRAADANGNRWRRAR
jgi:hypothetical protein